MVASLHIRGRAVLESKTYLRMGGHILPMGAFAGLNQQYSETHLENRDHTKKQKQEKDNTLYSSRYWNAAQYAYLASY